MTKKSEILLSTVYAPAYTPRHYTLDMGETVISVILASRCGRAIRMHTLGRNEKLAHGESLLELTTPPARAFTQSKREFMGISADLDSAANPNESMSCNG
jgi:hypothetical protein